MIAYVEGRLAEVSLNGCVVVTPGGVGYEVFLSGHTLGRLPARGEKVCLYTATIVREDALELFGFEAWDERETFLTLIGINRVGARTAMAILTVYRPEDLRRIVLEEDVMGLTRVSGIGKKSAQQIFLELKYKLKLDGGLPGVAGSGPGSGNTVFRDAVAGLENLGYSEEEASVAVKEALAAAGESDLGGLLRAALKILAGGRNK